MTLTLAQDGHSCTLSINLGSYTGMAELSSALAAGMTPVISYWSGDMLWMDGKGQDQRGPCVQDNPEICEDNVKFYGFSITKIGDPEPVVTIEFHDNGEAIGNLSMIAKEFFDNVKGEAIGNLSMIA